MKPWLRGFGRWLLWVLAAGLALQLFFLARIALMTVVAPESTAFQRSEAWRVATERERMRWSQQWVAYPQLSDHLKRAVIASEDASFVEHGGVDWEAIESAWKKNARRQAQALRQQAARPARTRRGAPASSVARPSPSNWRKTCSCRANGTCCARARSWC
jgi:monofunctional glycosyltransferase